MPVLPRGDDQPACQLNQAGQVDSRRFLGLLGVAGGDAQYARKALGSVVSLVTSLISGRGGPQLKGELVPVWYWFGTMRYGHESACSRRA